MEQPTPQISSADVERVVVRDFPANRVTEVFAIINEYGQENWHRELHRVRLAALKLAAGSIERLRAAIDTANCDYRDVLASAEYPSYCDQIPPTGDVPADEERRVIESDWRQYQEWLNR